MTVEVLGDGTGHVVSTPAGIDCPGTCTASFAAGVAPDLVATPIGTSKFGGWGFGPCQAAGTSCSVDAQGAVAFAALFDSDRVLLVSRLEEVGIGALALNSSHLFFAVNSWPGSGFIHAFPKEGARPYWLVSSDLVDDAVADDRELFWSAVNAPLGCLPGASATLLRISVPGGGSAAVLATGVGIHQLAMDDRFVYFSRAEEVEDCSRTPLDGKGAVLRIAKAGGTPEVLATAQTPTGALVVDGDTVVFGNRSQAGMEIRSVPRSGGTTTTLVRLEGTAAPLQLKADAGHLYLRDTSGRLIVINKAGSAPPMLLVSDSFQPVRGIDVHSGRLYWGQVGVSGGLWSSLPDGTDRTLFDRGSVSNLVVDDKYIFYQTGQRLLRRLK